MRGALADRPVVAVNRLLGAVGGERRGRVIGGWFVWSTGRRLGRSLMDTLRPPGKPFAISKWEVWEAYRQVKANKGAPGADGCSLEDFEKDLKGNLYKIWNRMSSGSYLPPPVLAVEIPKPHGEGTRVLGVPTIADRIAQTVVARRLEEAVEPIFHPDSYGYRPGRSALDAVAVCRRRCWAKNWVIDLDVERFFDSVPWDLLVKAVAAHTDQPWVVLYVTRWLQAPLQHPDGTVQQRDRGTPQGSAVTPPTQWITWAVVALRGGLGLGVGVAGVGVVADRDAVTDGDLVGADEDVFDDQPQHALALLDAGHVGLVAQLGEEAVKVVGEFEVQLTVGELGVERLDLAAQAGFAGAQVGHPARQLIDGEQLLLERLDHVRDRLGGLASAGSSR